MDQERSLRPAVACPVCGAALAMRPTRGRKSGKPGLMLICPVSGAHFRAFIVDQAYVGRVLDRLRSSDEGHPAV